MGRILAVLLLLTPFLEIATFIWVGGQIGILATLAAIVLTAVIGIAFLRWQGLGLLMDSRAMMARGEVPARQLADAMLLALAGLFLLIPGFLTDLAGFALLIPPVRGAIFAWLSANMVVVNSYRSTRDADAPRQIDLDPDDYR